MNLGADLDADMKPVRDGSRRTTELCDSHDMLNAVRWTAEDACGARAVVLWRDTADTPRAQLYWQHWYARWAWACAARRISTRIPRSLGVFESNAPRERECSPRDAIVVTLTLTPCLSCYEMGWSLWATTALVRIDGKLCIRNI